MDAGEGRLGGGGLLLGEPFIATCLVILCFLNSVNLTFWDLGEVPDKNNTCCRQIV